MASVIIIGPAYPLRGGIANFNHRLAEEFIQAGHSCEIFSFSLQYPGFLFPGKTQYSDAAPPAHLTIHPVINSVNPVSWISVGNRIKKASPDLVIVRYWLPFMGPALGTILRRIKKNKHSRIICIADNIIPHEPGPGDKAFTRYFLKPLDGVITMSRQVLNDLKKFDPRKPAFLTPHPLYDSFGNIVSKEAARKKLGLPAHEKIILFFGFIRKYKGLDLLLQAMKEEGVKAAGIKLLVAGEFYEDEKPYFELVESLGIKEQVIIQSDFIPDEEVKNYFGAADLVVQPYRHATQSGVTPLAYHFEKPMVVTNVGGLPEMVSDKRSGLVVHADPASIASGILDFFEAGESFFTAGLQEEKAKYSWDKMMQAILELAGINKR